MSFHTFSFFPVSCIQEIWDEYRDSIYYLARYGPHEGIFEKLTAFTPIRQNTFDEIKYDILVHVVAPSQLHSSQHGVDAEDSGAFQDFRVRDPVLPSQLQYFTEAAEMKVIQLPGLAQVDGPGLRSVKECRQDDDLVHLQFVVQVNTVPIPNGGLQPAEGLSGFGDPLGNLVIDSRVA
ncbi:unnamed protein product [Schistocephalus solidus]|uniref:Uncharacterized protein n=1 Tax=Schistocephalus solidus TaxID=70667 RepID=A0A3P7F5Z1_SCHSO|nr:unnamed protein product [Schistocephalus solidus]